MHFGLRRDGNFTRLTYCHYDQGGVSIRQCHPQPETAKNGYARYRETCIRKFCTSVYIFGFHHLRKSPVVAPLGKLQDKCSVFVSEQGRGGIQPRLSSLGQTWMLSYRHLLIWANVSWKLCRKSRARTYAHNAWLATRWRRVALSNACWAICKRIR